MNNTGLKIIPLGGIGEIGKNITVFETDNDIIIVDCGLAFPNGDMPGINIVIPDFTYLINKQDKIRALIITHAHEDHIGSIPFLLQKIKVPIYGTKFTMGIIEKKLEEFSVKIKPNIIKAGQKKKICEDFEIEFIHVNHSIPGAVALAIKTPEGTIIHTGDFKIDLSPIQGTPIDLTRFGEYGKKGVLALMMDSTNAENEGFSKSESVVARTLTAIFEKHAGQRLIIATFSSNVNRIQKIISLSEQYGRKVAIVGRSMCNVVETAVRIKYLEANDNTIISVNDISKYDPKKVTIITTGSQGETMSALSRMAIGQHNRITITNKDVVVLSAHTIPGNEKMVNEVVNKLYDRGVRVITDKIADIHASGHACQEELKLILSLVKPKYFIPVHGERCHLRANRKNARLLNFDNLNIINVMNGVPILFANNEYTKGAKVASGEILIDTSGLNDVKPAVIKDRQILRNDGVVVISFTIDTTTRTIISQSVVNSRGFVYMNESTALINKIRSFTDITAEELLMDKTKTLSDIKSELSHKISRFIIKTANQNPVVLIMLNEV